MTVTDQIKILDRTLKHNEAQHDLDRKAAKISVLFSGNLYKYESLTGEDLNYKPTTDEQARFYYFALNNFFNKKLQKETNKKVCRKDYKIFKIKTKSS